MTHACMRAHRCDAGQAWQREELLLGDFSNSVHACQPAAARCSVQETAGCCGDEVGGVQLICEGGGARMLRVCA